MTMPSSPGSFLYPASGIGSLPVELLSRIFTLGAGFNYPYEESPFLLKPNQDQYPPPSSFPLLASHVCHRWREIALRTPSFWTTIHFREPVHLARAQAYLERCSASSTYPYCLDILVDTVAPEDHIHGVTLCREELVQVFDIIIAHVGHWRSFHLKIRDNVCKATARRYLSTCGPAPSLETLQLYHFENYVTVDNLYEATHRPPVIVFENQVPKLRNVSLIGVNLPWLKSPYLMNLQKLELALHPDNIRPPYDSWDRMLRLSPQLESLNLHYSGPRQESSGEPSSAWATSKEKIALDRLVDLKFTDLDPDYLCGVVDRLYVPHVRRMAWHLPEQDFSVFVELLTKKWEKGVPSSSASGVAAGGGVGVGGVHSAADNFGSMGGGSSSSSAAHLTILPPRPPTPAKRRSKISISSLLSDSEPEADEQHQAGYPSIRAANGEEQNHHTPSTTEELGDSLGKDSEEEALGTAVARTAVRADILFAGPLPYLGRLETLAITALECGLPSWQELLRCLEGLKHLEVDFRRVPPDFWRVLTGSVELDVRGVARARGAGSAVLGAGGMLLLPHLETFRVAGIPGEELEKEMIRRAKKTVCGGGGLNRWAVRWSPTVKGDDVVLDELVMRGCIPSGRSCVKVEAYFEEDEEEAEEELEPDVSQDEDEFDSPGSP